VTKNLPPLFLFLALAALCADIAGRAYQKEIERDLTAKVKSSLQATGHPTGGIRFSGHELLTTALDPGLKGSLEEIIGAYIPPLSLPPPEIRSWVQITEAEHRSVALAGIVPDQRTKDALATAVLLAGPRNQLDDQIVVDEEATRLDYREHILLIIPKLLRTAHLATLLAEDGKLHLGGMVDSASQIAPLLQGVPAESSIKVQPLQHLDFQILRDSESITISGILPNTEVHKSLLDLIEASSGMLSIKDETTMALRPAKYWWHGYPDRLAPDFLSKSSGPIRLHFLHQQIVAHAGFRDQENLDFVRQMIDNLPLQIVRQIKLEILPEPPPEPIPAEIVVAPEPLAEPSTNAELEVEPDPDPEPEPDPPHPAGSLAAGLAELPIFFNKSSTYLKPSEWTKVDQAAQLILLEPDSSIMLSGFSGHRGDSQTNSSLARLRAKEVRKRLIKAGVSEDALKMRTLIDKAQLADPSRARRVEMEVLPINP